jgi:hypothetical protein
MGRVRVRVSTCDSVVLVGLRVVALTKISSSWNERQTEGQEIDRKRETDRYKGREREINYYGNMKSDQRNGWLS